MSASRLRLAIGLGVMLVSAVVVGAAFTTIPHTGGDNAGYVALAHDLLANGTYTDAFDPEGLKHTKYPPVFPLILAAMIALGARTWGVLKLSAALSTVAVAGLTYVWVERREGPLVGGAIAVVLTLSSGIVYYSHWILSDPTFLAFTMLALVAFGRVEGGAAEPPGTEERLPGGRAGEVPWLALGIGATGLAYFTRSAGLPLVLAVLGWLAMRGRWRALAASAAGLGVPMLLWWLRGRGAGVAQYGTEFWMVDPYDPSRGTIGVLGLFPRIAENGAAYLFQHGPAGIVGAGRPGLTVLGLGLAGLALVGWGLTVRRRVGVAELFFPLYTGLILVWPAVWGGDRFALPLYPLVFLYGAVSLRAGLARLPGAAGNALAAAAVLVLLLPAGAHWLDANAQNATCEQLARARGPWSCYGPRVGHFVEAGAWSASGLPADAAVLSRKPRHFYLLSGRPSRAFPFVTEPAAHLELADGLGARYVLLDRWDGLAARYVGGAVTGHPTAFCFVRGFGDPASGGAQLLGVLPAGQRGAPVGASGASVGIGACPSGYTVPDGAAQSSSDTSSGRIPLLDRLDS